MLSRLKNTSSKIANLSSHSTVFFSLARQQRIAIISGDKLNFALEMVTGTIQLLMSLDQVNMYIYSYYRQMNSIIHA